MDNSNFDCFYNFEILPIELAWSQDFISGFVFVGTPESQTSELKRPVFRLWWEGVARIELQAIAALFPRV